VLSIFRCAPRNLVAAALASAILAMATSALAQGDNMSLAKEAFSRGQTAFDAGRYEEARTAFHDSLEAFPHFRTLFNIALCDEKLGNVQEAIEMYQRYVDWPADVPNREEVAAKLAALKATLPPEPEPPVPPPVDGGEPQPPVAKPSGPAPERGPDLRVPGWIGVGTGAAGAVVGAVFLGLAQKKKKEMEGVAGEAYDPAVHDAIIEDGERFEKVGWVVGGFGVLVAAIGAVLLIASDDGDDGENDGGATKAEKSAAFVPIVSSDAVAAAVQWRF
jgi:tetratricopeptide (TPR) repeat protein